MSFHSIHINVVDRGVLQYLLTSGSRRNRMLATFFQRSYISGYFLCCASVGRQLKTRLHETRREALWERKDPQGNI